MKLYIVRHGQTDWNIIKRLQGQSDIDLNANGIAQATAASATLKNVHFDMVYSSPLCRAVHTTELLLGDRKLPINTDERLREMCFGVNEGLLPEERTEGCSVFFTQPELYVPAEGAESIEELYARTGSFLDEIICPLSLAHPDYTVLLVGHGALNRSLVQHLLHLEKKDFWSDSYLSNLYAAIFDIRDHEYTMLEDFHPLIPAGSISKVPLPN